ncbi:MAG: 2-amino-4-hydroxy-6-hydroxymethyldihydropteridine diphosphokinase [Erythrobacter sp.]|nr:2-amino-4-hydroxy-6-hydroxymethyldihydropteridine diphosphokinase [Erythrobacter sp.]
MHVPGMGAPRRVLAQAVRDLEENAGSVLAVSPVIDSAPIGPSLRRYANGALVLESELSPPNLLATLQLIEHCHGRRRAQRRGQRWRARALDLDIILWSGGVWASQELTIPHREMRERGFVLRPAAAIARGWRDPVTGHSLGQLSARLIRSRRARKKAPNLSDS